MGDKPRAELLGALASLYQARDYSDLIVFANDGSRHPVHRAIVCPRSQYFFDAVREGRWKDGIDGNLALPDDEPEVLRLLLEYFYLLDYTPTPPRRRSSSRPTSRPSPFPDTDSSDSLSTLSRDPAQYGNIYGASAISAFGGPQPHIQLQPQHGHPGSPWVPPSVYLNRSRTESQLTVHAMPLEYHGNFGQQHQHPKPGGHRRGSASSSGPEVSPLATEEPNLVLHARMYAAGRKFGVEGLKALALDKFKIQLTRHWDSPEFSEAIHVVYSTTPSHDKEMREAVADVLGWHSTLLNKPEVEVAIMEINGLAYELLKRSRGAGAEFMG